MKKGEKCGGRKRKGKKRENEEQERVKRGKQRGMKIKEEK